MDEESQNNSLWDFLSKAGQTAGDVYAAENRPTPPPAARAAQPASQPWLVPVIIGGALLLFGFVFVAVLGGRR